MSITGTKGTRALNKNYPAVDGIIAETTKQKGHTSNLLAQGLQGKKTAVPARMRMGL